MQAMILAMILVASPTTVGAKVWLIPKTPLRLARDISTCCLLPPCRERSVSSRMAHARPLSSLHNAAPEEGPPMRPFVRVKMLNADKYRVLEKTVARSG